MAIQYAGGTNVNATWTSDGTKQDIIDNIETNLLAAGWTTISGSGTTNLLMESLATPAGHQMRARIKDNSGSCATISIENVSGSIAGTNSTTGGAHLLPALGQDFRIIANKYQFCITVDSIFATARKFAFFSVPHVPFPTGVTDVGILIGGSISDSSATLPRVWRDSIATQQNFVPNFQVIWDASLFQNANSLQNSTNFVSSPGLILPLLASLAQVGGTVNSFPVGPRQWANGNYFSGDAIVGWGQTAFGDEFMARCQLWDAIVFITDFAGDQQVTFDTHDWFVVTNNALSAAAVQPKGTLMLVVP